MKKWTYKLTIIDYDKDEGEQQIIRSATSDFENVAYNNIVFALPASVDVLDVELLEEKP